MDELRLERKTTFTLEIGDLFMPNAKRIGKGMFSEAFSNGDNVIIVSSEADYSKEILVNLPPTQHLPDTEWLGYKGDKRVYSQKFYNPLKAKNKEAWQQYKLLRDASEKVFDEFQKKYFISERNFIIHHAFEVNDLILDKLNNIPDRLYDALSELKNSACNYGTDWLFEFAPRNLKVDENGHLILLDVLFSTKLAKKSQGKKF